PHHVTEAAAAFSSGRLWWSSLESLSDYEAVRSHSVQNEPECIVPANSDSAVQLVAFNASSGLCAHFRCHLGLSHCRKCRNANKGAQGVWTAGSDCWTTVQHRVSGSVDFYRNWTQYQSEFGEGPDGNYWIGSAAMRTRELSECGQPAVTAGPPCSTGCPAQWTFTATGLSTRASSARDPTETTGSFSTMDADHDDSSSSCAENYSGGWWFQGCYSTHPNGVYKNFTDAIGGPFGHGIIWKYYYGFYYSLMEYGQAGETTAGTFVPDALPHPPSDDIEAAASEMEHGLNSDITYAMNNKRQFALVLLAVACFAATQTQGRPSGEPEILDADDADTSVAEQVLNAMAETEDELPQERADPQFRNPASEPRCFLDSRPGYLKPETQLPMPIAWPIRNQQQAMLGLLTVLSIAAAVCEAPEPPGSISWTQSFDKLEDYEVARTERAASEIQCVTLASRAASAQVAAYDAKTELCRTYRCRMGLPHCRKCRNVHKGNQAVWTASTDCWITIQHRTSSSTSFNASYAAYKSGFGEGENGNFWIGLRTIRDLTSGPERQLLILMKLWNGTESFARYTRFSVDTEDNDFKLFISGFSGSSGVGDDLAQFNGKRFSARDDASGDTEEDCARDAKGAWWFAGCPDGHLNGAYQTSSAVPGKGQGVIWSRPYGAEYSLKEVEMLLV
uniref:Fibrinogen C-terminal domain-containing protein n=2 Tax=Macrostomum lignano TaxID=282301 RepID=A0A1I8GLH4_9PLAT